jgi:hypothetical protein
LEVFCYGPYNNVEFQSQAYGNSDRRFERLARQYTKATNEQRPTMNTL